MHVDRTKGGIADGEIHTDKAGANEADVLDLDRFGRSHDAVGQGRGLGFVRATGAR